ncbi:hypothetical protein AJ79_03323 [Helicocarpus griseus UAMH5409]|uniref:Copper-fist domain-containing protein n=1 Tax=Helicocarpus griseus UAMH5409 TaxID=1447875 RepID=A0A2B7XZB2_9EURO|nr:hypothetical protein AJ79_03323 [Helicocarpus griseus UAMH5409]
MPLDEEGAKWSCEPCVRGHRSSKCQHFDRLMMKVPKAGRPLAKCPHPKGTCSCQKLYAFMVRIPKGSTCLCRPLYQVPMVVTEAGPAAGPATQPASGLPAPPVSSVSSNPNRIQKRSRRQNSLQAAPELVAKGLDLAAAPSNDFKVTGNNAPGHTPHIGHSYSRQYYPISPSTAYPRTQQPNAGSNSKELYPSQPQTGNVDSEQPAGGGCCSSKPPPKPVTQQARSCCSSKPPKSTECNDSAGHLKQEEGAASHPSMPEIAPNPVPSYRQTWEHRSYSTPELAKQPHDHHNPLSRLQNGNPISNFQVQETSSAPVTGYSSPIIMPGYTSMNQTLSHFPSSAIPDYGFQTSTDCQPHNCDCGDGCQCLGCASHPFNDTTRQHIQQMGYLITSRDDDQGSEPNGNGHNPSFSGQPIPAGFDYHNLPQNPFQFQSPSQMPWNDAKPGQDFETSVSTPAAPAVYDPNHGEMMMQPAAYYELEYPVGLLDPCTNMTGTCQCGVNCSCVGCLTHSGHDGVQLELSPPLDHSGTPVTDTACPVPQTYHSVPTTAGNGYSNEFTAPPQSPVPVTPLPV